MAFIRDDGGADGGGGGGGSGTFFGRGGGGDQVLTSDVRTGAPEASGGGSEGAGGAKIIPDYGGANLLALRSQLHASSGTVAAPEAAIRS